MSRGYHYDFGFTTFDEEPDLIVGFFFLGDDVDLSLYKKNYQYVLTGIQYALGVQEYTATNCVSAASHALRSMGFEVNGRKPIEIVETLCNQSRSSART